MSALRSVAEDKKTVHFVAHPRRPCPRSTPLLSTTPNLAASVDIQCVFADNARLFDGV